MSIITKQETIKCKVGMITVSTTATSVSGLGFSPMAIFFFSLPSDATTGSGGMGLWTNTGTFSSDHLFNATIDVGNRWATEVYPLVDYVGDVATVSATGDGFTTESSGFSGLMGYLAIGY